ncbi:hypothetical protein KM043_006825 [Ampulex compressa]|nr:hypothetical protein KM043_006825 [Ampulex compressa]
MCGAQRVNPFAGCAGIFEAGCRDKSTAITETPATSTNTDTANFTTHTCTQAPVVSARVVFGFMGIRPMEGGAESRGKLSGKISLQDKLFWATGELAASLENSSGFSAAIGTALVWKTAVDQDERVLESPSIFLLPKRHGRNFHFAMLTELFIFPLPLSILFPRIYGENRRLGRNDE